MTNEDISLGNELSSGVFMIQSTYGNKISIMKVTKIQQ